MAARTVDIHTHMYPPSYISLLKSRTTVPYIRDVPNSSTSRLIILPSDDDPAKDPATRGRPVGPDFWDVSRKLAFMDAHGISTSVISLANPWLDFLPASAAAQTATQLNSELNAICAAAPAGRLFFFGVLPLPAASVAAESVITELARLPHARGVVMGTTGLGAGLDDPGMQPIFAALAAARLPVLLHPHYGLPAEVWGPRDYGHVLPLALGFPVETTVAVARMWLAGVWDRCNALQVILAHAGGAVPFLAGRIESCVAHDAQFRERPRRGLWEVLKENVYLDAVVYSQVGLKAAAETSGADRVMFGTDHPFFPPLEGDGLEWLSVASNVRAVEGVYGEDRATAEAIMGGNAIRLLGL